MMPVQTDRAHEPRGLRCPSCRTPIGARYVAKAYPSPAGVYRLRHCQCGASIETSEAVIGIETEVLDISDLNAAQVKLVRTQVDVLRSSNREVAFSTGGANG